MTTNSAVLLFAISVNVAAVTRWLAPLVHPNDSHAFYGLLNSVFMSSFVVFPALALQSLTPGLPHRRGIRLFLWTWVVIFAAVVEGLYRYIYMTDYFLTLWTSAVEFNEDLWLSNCDSVVLRVRLGYLTMAGHIFLTVDCLWYVYQATAKFRRGNRGVRKVKDKVLTNTRRRAWWRERWESVQPYLRLGNGFLSLVFMWLFLGLFTAYREDVRHRAGDSDQDGEWTFGQVLSLATWAPVAVELANVYLCEYTTCITNPPLPLSSLALELVRIMPDQSLTHPLFSFPFLLQTKEKTMSAKSLSPTQPWNCQMILKHNSTTRACLRKRWRRSRSMMRMIGCIVGGTDLGARHEAYRLSFGRSTLSKFEYYHRK